jgi:origin recognition complex subunit 1
MPSKNNALTPRQKRQEKAARATKILSGASFGDDSSDDDSCDWEWIYESRVQGDGSTVDENSALFNKRRRNTLGSEGGTIFGARLGTLECWVGDVVRLTADGAEGGKEVWLGMIASFLDNDDGEMVANFLCTRIVVIYFSSANERSLGFVDKNGIYNKSKKRSDALPVRILSSAKTYYANPSE